MISTNNVYDLGSKELKIIVKPSCFSPEFEMIVSVPNDRGAEEYIDDLLDGILKDEFRYNVEWYFDV